MKNGKIDHFTITLKNTKTDLGYCDVQHVVAKGTWPVAPMQLLRSMLLAREQLSKTNPKLELKRENPLFQLSEGSILTKNDMKKRMTKLIEDMAIPWPNVPFQLHSFRIGGATSLARRMIDHRLIQLLGRWKSNVYQMYIRYESIDIANHFKKYYKMPIKNDKLVFEFENIPSQ
jgi:hypothetical protein